VGAFEELHGDRVSDSLAMFDRMIFKGHLSALYKQDGARCFLWSQGVALKDFTAYATATTERIANNARKLVTDAGRPVISFDHVKTRNRSQHKDELAKRIAEADGITNGIICLISAVESCFSFQVRKRHSSGRLELFRRERKCLHHYLYLIDPEFGFMHVRLQGWIPYECQIYTNGREWLAPLRPAGGDHHHQSARVPDPTRRHRQLGPARAAVVPDAKGRERPVAHLPGGDRGQPLLPRRPGRRPTEGRRRRRARRLAPAPNLPRAPLRPLQHPQRQRPCPVPGRPRGRTRHPRLPQLRHHQAALPTPARRPSQGPATMRTTLPLIVKLRGHGLVAKIPRARRYRVTRYGHRVMTAAIALHDDNFADHYRAA
jgi:hypothetical protein